jgi:AcrR family transcriptional regulator
MPKTKDLTARGRREQILDEAQRLFVAHGAHSVTTRHIAHAVGISQPSLYAHFPNKDSIAVELCCRAFEDLYQRLVRASQKHTAPLDRLRALGHTYIRFGLDNPAAYQVAFVLDLPPEATPEKNKILVAGVRSFGVLRETFNISGLSKMDADAMAQSVWASMHGLVALLLARGEFPWVQTEGLIALHVDLICDAASLALTGKRVRSGRTTRPRVR